MIHFDKELAWSGSLSTWAAFFMIAVRIFEVERKQHVACNAGAKKSYQFKVNTKTKDFETLEFPSEVVEFTGQM